MMPRHHPGDELILAHVTGGLAEAMDVAIASHLWLCPACREAAACMEAVGGLLLEQLDDAPLAVGALRTVLSRLDEPWHEIASPFPGVEDLETRRLLPPPLRAFVGRRLAALSWKDSKPGVSLAVLATRKDQGIKAVLARVEAGSGFPQHVHDRLGLALVLAGGISDQRGHYRRGDVLVTEPGEAHRTIMDEDEDCLCFGITAGRSSMIDPMGRPA